MRAAMSERAICISMPKGCDRHPDREPTVKLGDEFGSSDTVAVLLTVQDNRGGKNTPNLPHTPPPCWVKKSSRKDKSIAKFFSVGRSSRCFCPPKHGWKK
eukprot:TRINITY_DN17387_c0_g1_i1.p12 TRINITY_DN17387_c0_g1~~TRINITY_DN17387_c0_g1_i1.p12  ORF type:complete len:100 (-),score=4.90 TRINITY_DN17387_c0_g1_i1:1079-1378(-)